MSLSIVLIHGDDTLRAALARGFDSCDDLVLVASVRSAEAGVSAFEQQPDAIVLIEQQPGDGTGRTALVEELKEIDPRVQTVMLIGSVEPPSIISAVRSGVRAIVHQEFAAMAEAVRLVRNGVCVFDPEALHVLMGPGADLPRNPLSSREREVLSCLAVGLSNAEAASKLFVSRETVKTHVAHVLRKLEVEDRASAVDKATRIGLLT